MGCFNSKHAASAELPNTISRCSSTLCRHRVAASSPEGDRPNGDNDTRKSRKLGSPDGRISGVSLKSGLLCGNVEAEQAAAGWPSWLTSSAPEAVYGWVPLRAEAFQKLEKIGQGTYSSVFRGMEIKTGRVVALKKVRIDNFKPANIRFMAREITILRRLDHPNIMKLQGIITSRNSTSMYFVFDYMEHDLAGLSSSPDVKFTESQIKCYMKQLLLAVEHCHLRGIMHRDIKASNILVNNRGTLKLADFGLANIITPRNKNHLTSRVVTLWYRAPELLMGSRNYGVSADLWSVGCVFAEILLGKPILKGRTEIEQLHKIYRFCGTPPEEFWEKSKLPRAAMFKPQHSYEGTRQEMFKEFPAPAVKLLETLLSIDPEKRGTASSALMLEYLNTEPYPCDPSTLPKYPPNKERDAKNRERLQRRKSGINMTDLGAVKKLRRAGKIAKEEKTLHKHSKQETRAANKADGGDGREAIRLNILYNTPSGTSQAETEIQGDYLYTDLSNATAPASGFVCGKKQKDQDAISTLTDNQKSSGSQVSGTSMLFAKNTYGLR